jgi:DNA-binding transcriptional regulator YhcF (GntR family)
MQLWFARKSAVTIRKQLVTQIVLGILGDDLIPGQRLPSTRELARRFRLHPNTISAGYRQLERAHWVEFRHGSGVYVRESRPKAAPSSALAMDQLIAELFRSARKFDVPLNTVRSRLRHWLDLQPPDHFFLIEPDEELRKIVAMEMQQAVTLPVKSSDLPTGSVSDAAQGAIFVALPSKAEIVRQALPVGAELLTLQVRSVPTSLAGWLPAPSNALVGIASRWDNFVKLARTLLIASGFHPDTLIFRDAKKTKWQKRLRAGGGGGL